MSEVREMDPALARLLRNLPTGNPDAVPEKAPPEEPERVELRIPFCEGVHVVEQGRPATLVFGPWYGPTRLVKDITIRARNLKTGAEKDFGCGGWDARTPFIQPGDTFVLQWKGKRV